MNQTVYKNASIVTGLSVAERVLGFLYRVVLSRLIGAEGLGLYQVSLSLFSLFLTVGTGGIPITLSRTLAKSKAAGDIRGEQSTISAGLVLCLLLSLPCCLFLWTFGNKMTFLFSDERSFSVFRILLLGLSFACVYAVVRGYFWGNKRFLAASLLETAEEIIMVLVGVALLKDSLSPLDGAKRAAWALTVADILACGVALVCFFACGGKLGKPQSQLKPLFTASLPITAVRASGSLMNSAVAVLLPAMLIAAGYSQSDALGVFGVVSGMVIPVLFIPSTLIGSLALVLVPELSEDFYRKKQERLKTNIERGLRFSLLVACALIPLFFVLGRDFGRLAFSNALAGEMIAKSCILLLPMSLTIISNSMLNSIGFERQTFCFFFLGAAALLVCVLSLPSLCGGYAYVIGLGASYTINAACNLVFLKKKCPFLFKRGGQVRVQALLPALLGILPVSFVGQLCHAYFSLVFGEVLCVAFTALVMGLATVILYLSTKQFSLPRFKQKR